MILAADSIPAKHRGRSRPTPLLAQAHEAFVGRPKVTELKSSARRDASGADDGRTNIQTSTSAGSRLRAITATLDERRPHGPEAVQLL